MQRTNKMQKVKETNDNRTNKCNMKINGAFYFCCCSYCSFINIKDSRPTDIKICTDLHQHLQDGFW